MTQGLETSFELLLWRTALADGGPVPTGTDLAEWAEMLAKSGAAAAATLLDDVACLYRGFPPPTSAGRARREPAREWTLHIALDEMLSLARDLAPAGLPGLAPARRAEVSGRPDNPAGIGDGIPAPPAPDDIAALARQLRLALESDFGGDAAASAADLHARLVEAHGRLPFLDHRTFAQTSLDLLAPAIATAGLTAWALGTRDLVATPLGSPLLLHRAARLDGAGLGPYFRNVGRLVRDAADLFDLARLAAAETDGGGARATIGAWIALLSRGCQGTLLCEIVDDLGDSDAGDVLRVILDRAVSRPAAAIDFDMIFRIRDAALDNADYPLAIRAQRAVVRSRPDSKLEAVILGTIEASGGDYVRAEATFRHWLARSADDADLRARLSAVRASRFEEFRVARGFGSPADRQDSRLRRRGIVPDYPRRRGERIEAVDVR